MRDVTTMRRRESLRLHAVQLLLLLGAGVAMSCAPPRIPEGKLSCSSANDCPSGWICQAHFCFSKSAHLEMKASDASTKDAGGADAGAFDSGAGGANTTNTQSMDAARDAGDARALESIESGTPDSGKPNRDASSSDASGSSDAAMNGIVVDAEPADLGDVGLAASAQAMITVTNETGHVVGTPVLETAGLTVGTFAFESSTCTHDLAPHESCTAVGIFTATSLGTNSFNATATATPGGVGVASLSVHAVAAATLELSAAALNFDVVTYKFASSSLPLTLTNRGAVATGTLQLATTGTNAADFAETDDCPPVLAAGNSCTLGITVTPSDLGMRGATFQASASPGGDVSATLSATSDYAYSKVDDMSHWATVDMKTVSLSSGKYNGTAFDGRYLYFVPGLATSGYNGIVARYDTLGNLTSTDAWTTFDISTLNAGAKNFGASAFDGRYVYFVTSRIPVGGIVARYDTHASFTASASWTIFDTTTADANAKGFSGAVFDGRYLYLVPNSNAPATFDGLIARYDTQMDFTQRVDWTTFDITTVDAGAKGFNGGVFDGRYLYLVPTSNNNGSFDGIVARYDTYGTFGAQSAWTTFDTGTVSVDAKGFQGAAFDGRYVYFVPYRSAMATWSGTVVRYDTQAIFDTSSSWSTFDTIGLDPNAKGYGGAVFDGRYVYFVPFDNGMYSNVEGVVARYDTRAGFTTPGSWSTFDTATLDSNAVNFFGAAFDGRYVYFVPNALTTLARFDAQQPPSMPRLCTSSAALYCYSGSFF